MTLYVEKILNSAETTRSMRCYIWLIREKWQVGSGARDLNARPRASDLMLKKEGSCAITIFISIRSPPAPLQDPWRLRNYVCNRHRLVYNYSCQ